MKTKAKKTVSVLIALCVIVGSMVFTVPTISATSNGVSSVTDFPSGSGGLASSEGYTLLYTFDSNNNATITGFSGLPKDIAIPSSIGDLKVTKIDDNAFYDCDSLSSITLPSSVTEIGWFAFSDCDVLASVTLPSSLTLISSGAFSGCVSLKSITIPSSVTSLDGNVFTGCNSLQTITVNQNNKVYDSRNNCNAIIETKSNTLITGCKNTKIPDTVEKIDCEAFYECESLTSITIPSSVIKIDCNAFYNCCSLQSVALSSTVEIIAEHSFTNCVSLKSITIPSSVTILDGNVFSGCSSLQTVTVNQNNKVYDSRNNCNAIIETISNTLITGCKNTKIPETIKKIGDNAFFGCKLLTSISIPNSVSSIGILAFVDCGLKKIVIPNSVTTVGAHAFLGCASLESVTISNSLKEINAGTFAECHSLNNVIIPNSVITLYRGAFADCDSLKSVTIPKSVTKINLDTYDAGELPDSFKNNKNLVISCYQGSYAHTYAKNNGIKYRLINLPAQITDIKNAKNGVSLSYKKATEAVYYRIYRSTSKTGKYSAITTTKKTSYVDKNVKSGNIYYYKVRGLDASKSFVTQLSSAGVIRYLAPTKLSGGFTNDKSVTLKWKKVTGAKRYHIIRQDKNTGKVKNFYTTSLTLLDKTVKVDHTYYYYIVCENAKYTSAIKNAVSIILYPLPAPKITSVSSGKNGIIIKWKKVSGAKRYCILRKTANSKFKAIKYTKGLSFTDKSVKKGVTYYYNVCCVHESKKQPVSGTGANKKITYK